MTLRLKHLEIRPGVWRLLWGAAFLLITGYAAGSCGKPTNRELEAAHNATAVAVQWAREAEDARAARELETQAAVQRAEARADKALAVADAAAARRPTIIERVIERAGADSAIVRVAVEEVVDSIQAREINPLRAALVARDSAFAAQGRLLAAERVARVAAQEGLRTALLEVDALRDARPSWFSRNGPKIAIPLALAGGWWLRGQLGR